MESPHDGVQLPVGMNELARGEYGTHIEKEGGRDAEQAEDTRLALHRAACDGPLVSALGPSIDNEHKSVPGIPKTFLPAACPVSLQLAPPSSQLPTPTCDSASD